MEDKRILSFEELESVSGGGFCTGKLTEKDISLLNCYISLSKERGGSKQKFLEKWAAKGASEETLAYIDANW